MFVQENVLLQKLPRPQQCESLGHLLVRLLPFVLHIGKYTMLPTTLEILKSIKVWLCESMNLIVTHLCHFIEILKYWLWHDVTWYTKYWNIDALWHDVAFFLPLELWTKLGEPLEVLDVFTKDPVQAGNDHFLHMVSYLVSQPFARWWLDDGE